MAQFIYVFTLEARDELLSSGYKLLKSDLRAQKFVFANNQNLTFSNENVSCIYSDTLTF